MSRAKKNTTTPATKEVKEVAEVAEVKESKPMNEKKNTTTPATSTPAPAESKRTPAKKKEKKNQPQTIAKIEDNNIVLQVVKQTVDTHGVSTELIAKKLPIPANAKAEQLSNLANLVQVKVLLQLKEKFASELVKACKMKKSQTVLSDEQKEKKARINAKIKLVNSTLKKLGLDEEKARVLVINEPMAEILASYVTGWRLSLELSNLKACLRANYQTISSLVDKLIKEGSASATDEEKEVFTKVRQAIKKDLDGYTADTFYFNKFKLSVSTSDIRKWYEVSRLDIAEDVFIFDDKKDTKLSNAIVKWFLTKIKVEEKEEPASK